MTSPLVEQLKGDETLRGSSVTPSLLPQCTMDDLAGIDWSKDSRPQQKANSSYSYNASAFAALKPTPPTSGRVTPLNGPSSQPPSKPVTPANDSFSNLIPFSSNRLQDEREPARAAEAGCGSQATERRGGRREHCRITMLPQTITYGTTLEAAGVRRSIGEQRSLDESPKTGRGAEEDDIFSAFGSTAMPPPRRQPAVHAPQPDDDDDPFGLSEMQKQEA